MTLSTPSNDPGVIIEIMSTLGEEVALYGRLAKSENPGVLVETVETVQGRLPVGPGNPHEMNGMAPPLGCVVTDPESSPFNPQALLGDLTFRPVMFSKGPGCGAERFQEIATTMMTTTTTTKQMAPIKLPEERLITAIRRGFIGSVGVGPG